MHDAVDLKRLVLYVENRAARPDPKVMQPYFQNTMEIARFWEIHCILRYVKYTGYAIMRSDLLSG